MDKRYKLPKEKIEENIKQRIFMMLRNGMKGHTFVIPMQDGSRLEFYFADMVNAIYKKRKKVRKNG